MQTIVRASARFSSSATSAPILESSVLPNGVKVITLNEPDRPGVYLSQVAMKVGSGTKDETAQTSGANHVLRYLALQRSQNKSPLRVVRELELSTACFSTVSTRDALYYVGAVPPPSVPHFVENLFDFLTPKLREYIFRDLRPLLLEQAALSRKEHALSDLAHAAAFNYTGYGRPLAPSDAAVSALTPDRVQSYLSQHFVGPNISLIGYRVPHNVLLAEAKEKLSHLPSTTPIPTSTSFAYTGGSTTSHTDLAPTQVLLGFGAPSADGSAALTVAAEVLGSSLGTLPGDGINSKFAQVARSRSETFSRLSAHYHAYEKAGLFIAQAEGKPGSAKALTEALWEELQNSAKRGVTAEEVERAKKALLRKCEEKRVKGEWLCGANVEVDKVDAGAVNASLKKILAGPATVVTKGDARGAVSALP